MTPSRFDHNPVGNQPEPAHVPAAEAPGDLLHSQAHAPCLPGRGVCI
jgi:hypothetical protein